MLQRVRLEMPFRNATVLANWTFPRAKFQVELHVVNEGVFLAESSWAQITHHWSLPLITDFLACFTKNAYGWSKFFIRFCWNGKICNDCVQTFNLAHLVLPARQYASFCGVWAVWLKEILVDILDSSSLCETPGDFLIQFLKCKALRNDIRRVPQCNASAVHV